MILEQANNEEQISLDFLTYEIWGGSLPLKLYLEQQRSLREHPCLATRMKTWVFKDKDNTILCSCEAFQMTSSHGTVFALSTGFTPRKLRSQGYGSKMTPFLMERLKSEGGVAAIIFSDIGIEPYSKLGYIPKHAQDLIVPAKKTELDPKIKFFKLNELGVKEDIQSLQKYLEGFYVLPSWPQFLLHLELEKMLSHRPRFSGAKIGDSILIWRAEHKSNSLHSLLFMPRSSQDAKALINAAQTIGAEIGVKNIVFWIESPHLPFWKDLSQTDQIVNRESSIPMIYPLKPEIDATQWNWIPFALWV